MRNKIIKNILFFFMILPFFSSCAAVEKASIHKNFDIVDKEVSENDELSEWFVNVSGNDIFDAVSSNQDFILFIGSPTCYACNVAKPNLINYVYETKAEILYLNTANLDFSQEYQKFNSVLDLNSLLNSGRPSTPTLIVVKEKNVFASTIGSDKFERESSTRNYLKSLINVVDSYNIRSLTNFFKIENNEDPIVIFYSAQKTNQFFATLKAKINNYKGTNYVLILNFSNLDGIELIEQNYQFNCETELIIKKKNRIEVINSSFDFENSETIF